MRADPDNNGVALANTPNFDFIMSNYPSAFLKASGVHVGLPQNQMGNSEVGHTTIGAGRAVKMTLPKIDQLISDGSLKNSRVLKKFINELKKSGGAAHIGGLLSDGGVHSHQNHIEYIANVIAKSGVKVKIHCFMDGRDTSPKSGIGYFSRLKEKLLPGVEIVSLIGRYFAMDRDLRWDRTEKAYRALIEGKGKKTDDLGKAIAAQYREGVTDEFLEPVVLDTYGGVPSNGDSFFFVNFRADRARQLLMALLDPEFSEFNRTKIYSFKSANGLIEYSKKLNSFIKSMTTSKKIRNTLGECLSRQGLRQLRVAETEKYAHVTYFFNAALEKPYPGESRVLIPSPKVATYDLKPQMAAEAVTKTVLAAIDQKIYDVIIVNYANPDMVGHTGDLAATILACEAVDSGVGEIIKAMKKVSGVFVLTSDHGNCEQMLDYENNLPHTAHTLNPVPLSIVGFDKISRIRNGTLSDIAPTVLDLLSAEKPSDMTGVSLLIK